jgi:hypothetical protein
VSAVQYRSKTLRTEKHQEKGLRRMSNKIKGHQWVPTVISVVVGVAVWFMFERVISKFGLTGGFSYWWMGYGIMVVAAGVIGYFFRNRPWRWGVYISIAHVVVASFRSVGDHNMLPLEIIFFAALIFICVLASYFGAWLSKRFTGSPD